MSGYCGLMRWFGIWGALFIACGSDPTDILTADAGDQGAPDVARSDTSHPDLGSGRPDLGFADGGALDAETSADVPPVTDPFAPQGDLSEGLTNVSADLSALLENGSLSGACAAWEADPNNRRKLLLCGKYMFFYEAFGTVGVPAVIVDFLGQEVTDIVGPGWSNYGMILDPNSAEGRPLGLAPGAPLGQSASLAFTCASCHFGRLPDGRYAVGAPNHDYDYGGQILSMVMMPSLLRPGADPAAHHPDAIARVQPLSDRFASDRRLRLRLLLDLLPLLGADAPTMDRDTEGHYAHWKLGTMDFLISPLPVDDGVHTISKINALFGIPTPQEEAQAGMLHGMLGWTGVATSVMGFLRGFVIFGGGPEAMWPPERLLPLEQYILSLTPPANLTPPPADSVARGAVLFETQGCLGCHQGPRGSGLELYSYEEIGTDPEMKKWLDPDLDGTHCCDLELQPGERVTHALKSPRLVGLWAQKRFLHNGSLDSVESVLCLDSPRGQYTEPAYTDVGHTNGCGLSEYDRRDLVAYLLAH